MARQDGSPDTELNSGTAVSMEDTSPVPGMDWKTFHNYVVRALAGDDGVPGAVLTHVGAALERGERDLEKRDRQWWRDMFLHHIVSQSLSRINDGLGELSGIAGWYRQQAQEMREEMDQIAQRMGERSAFIEEAASIIDKWGRERRLDLERALDALRKRGIETNNRMSDAQILALLRDNHQRALEEQSRDSKRHDHLDKLQQEFDRKAEEIEKSVEGYKQERDRIMNDPDLSDEERARQLEELERHVGESVVHAAQAQERDQELREASRLESEVSRDIAMDVDDRNPFMALADNFAAQADPNQPQKAPDHDTVTGTTLTRIDTNSPGVPT